MTDKPKTVAIACWFGGKVLIAKRKNTATYPDYWGFPGGKVEPGELPLRAAQRELMEETRLFMALGDYDVLWGISEAEDPTTRLCLVFDAYLMKCEVDYIKNVEQDKHYDWEWRSPQDLMKEEKLMPGIRRYLEDAMERLGDMTIII